MLTNIWLNAADRNPVTEAADRIDRLLASDPLNQGESREGDDRVLFVPPLNVDFRVLEGLKKVIVMRVRSQV